MKFLRTFLSLTVFVLVFVFFAGLASAARSNDATCSSDDRNLFPYGFMCGTDPRYTDPMNLEIRNGSSPSILKRSIVTGQAPTIDGGTTLHISGAWSGTGFPKDRNGAKNATETLTFITIHARNDPADHKQINGLHVVSSSINKGGSDSLGCPGIGSINPDGNSGNINTGGPSGPGKIWGDRDIDRNGNHQDYSKNAAQGVLNKDDASPVAYNPDTNFGIINCGDHGKMVYWKSTAASSNSYKFDINVDADFDATDVCLRMNLAVKLTGTSEQGADQRYFPLAQINNMPPNSGPGAPTDNNLITATHIVKQSDGDEDCINIRKIQDIVLPPERNLDCDQYDKTPLASHSLYRFTYFSVDQNYIQGAPQNGWIVPGNPAGWKSFNAPYIWQSPGGSDDALNTNDGLWSWDNNKIRYFAANVDGAGQPRPRYLLINFGNPDGPDRNLYIEWWQHIDTNGDGNRDSWQYNSSPDLGPGAPGNATVRNCYAATCTIDVNSSEIMAGQEFTANLTIHNSGLSLLPTPLGGAKLSFVGSGPPWTGVLADSYHSLNGAPNNAGQSQTVYLVKFTAPTTPGYYTLSGYAEYPGVLALHGTRSGGSSWGGTCSGGTNGIIVKKDFVLDAIAVEPGGNVENPGASIPHQTVITSTIADQVNVQTDSTYTDRNGQIRDSFNGKMSVSNPPAQVTVLDAFSLVNQPVRAGDTYCSYIKIDHSKGTLGPNGPDDITWDDDPLNGGGPDEDRKCLTVHNKPYFKVSGTGVSAGGDFEGTSCQGVGKGIVGSFNNNTVGVNTYGGVSEYAVLALLSNTGAATGVNQGISPPIAAAPIPTNGSALSFANTGPGVTTSTNKESPVFGGKYAANHCIKKLKQPPDNPLPTIAGNTRAAPLSSIASGQYTHTGNLTFDNNNIPPPAVKNLEIFVDGDVSIKDNIAYPGGGTPGSASSFVLHATGNIYIERTVSELDGYYVAEGNGSTTGKIFTCANDFTPVAVNALYTDCGTQLLVYGAFAANKVNLMRTYGSLRDGTVTGNIPYRCANSPGFITNGTCAAEVFKFPPELFLSSPAGSTVNSGGPYDSIRSLPPVL